MAPAGNRHASQAAEKVFRDRRRENDEAIRRATRDDRAPGIHFATPEICRFERPKDFFRSLVSMRTDPKIQRKFG
jgi:hypothetical protein